MELKNVCIFSGINKVDDYLVYLLDKDRHKNQEIIHNDILNKYELHESNAKKWKYSQQYKQGYIPKPLSVVISFPMGTSKDRFITNTLEKLHVWISKISAINDLGLNESHIQEFVRSIPIVGHYKKSNPHVHILMPKVFPNKKNSSLEYINIYKYKYSDILYKLSGWSTIEKVKHKQQEQKEKRTKSTTVYLKDSLYDQIDKYRNLNDKLDKYITLIEKDLSRGHTEKAQKKLQKIRTKNG